MYLIIRCLSPPLFDRGSSWSLQSYICAHTFSKQLRYYDWHVRIALMQITVVDSGQTCRRAYVPERIWLANYGSCCSRCYDDCLYYLQSCVARGDWPLPLVGRPRGMLVYWGCLWLSIYIFLLIFTVSWPLESSEIMALVNDSHIHSMQTPSRHLLLAL